VLDALREKSRSKTYRPAPARRVQIKRPAEDYEGWVFPGEEGVVQMAVHPVLIAIFEENFHP
jgi:retron-type reverse transcriptase